MKKISINKEFLELYNAGLDDSKIGRILNVNHVTIKNVRERLNLPSIFKYKRKFSEEKYLEYYKEGKNDAEISKLLNVSKSALQEYRSKLGLKHNCNIYDNVSLNYDQEQVLIGTLFGDAHLTRVYKNTSGEFVHCKNQKEYCFWKYEKLKDFCALPKDSCQAHYITKKVYYKVICRILTNPVFNFYYDLSYKNRIKYISRELLYKLDGLGIATWFMDDGYKQKSSGSYSIATNGFSDLDRSIIIEFFKNKFNIKVTSHKSGIIYIYKQSALTFKKLIEPYIIESMKYKL